MTPPDLPEPVEYIVALTGRKCTEFLARRGPSDLLVVGTVDEALRFATQDEAEVYAQEVRRDQVGDLYRVSVLPTYVPPSAPLTRPLSWWRRLLLRLGL